MRPVDSVLRPLRAVFAHRLAGAGLLLGAAAIALAWAWSPWAHVYEALLETPGVIGLGPFVLAKDLHHWINDGAMALFFFVVGLELKREVLGGALSTVRQAALPALCALGGMIAPAALYLTFHAGSDTSSGWGVPTATDIAFALGVLALLGHRVPPAMRTFLTAVAVADDLGAVVVIAVFYTPSLALGALVLGALGLAAAVALNVGGVRSPAPYVVVGLFVWLCFHASGVHATIAAVLLAFTVPARGGHGLLVRLEHALSPLVTFVVLPVFAFANAGVVLDEPPAALLGSGVLWGVLAGLVVGKPVGIGLAAVVAVKLKLAAPPAGLGLKDVAALGVLGGVGFTMSLFIAELAFADPALVDAARIGVLAGSALSAAAGLVVLGLLYRPPRRAPAAGAHPRGATA